MQRGDVGAGLRRGREVCGGVGAQSSEAELSIAAEGLVFRVQRAKKGQTAHRGKRKSELTSFLFGRPASAWPAGLSHPLSLADNIERDDDDDEDGPSFLLLLFLSNDLPAACRKQDLRFSWLVFA